MELFLPFKYTISQPVGAFDYSGDTIPDLSFTL